MKIVSTEIENESYIEGLKRNRERLAEQNQLPKLIKLRSYYASEIQKIDSQINKIKSEQK
jgi:hypothetical protein